MEAISTEGIPASDELAQIIDGIIQQRLLIVLAEDEQHVKLQEQKLVLLSEKRRQHWQALQKWGKLVNSWTGAVALIAIIFALGLYTGLNLLPQGVICKTRESFCYFLRFDHHKRILKR